MPWLPAPTDLILGPGVLHVWKANLNAHQGGGASSYMEIMSEDERVRATRFKFNKHKTQFILTRGILRKLLSQYLSCGASEITFEYGEQGKPGLSDETSLQFNISHAGDYALFGFSEHLEIGIDIEHIQPQVDIEDLAKRFFSKAEARALFGMPAEQRLNAFYTCWTRKEAFIKARGTGLSTPLDQFEVSLSPGQPAALIATHWNPEEVAQWSLYALDVPQDYAGAVSIKGQNVLINNYLWIESDV